MIRPLRTLIASAPLIGALLFLPSHAHAADSLGDALARLAPGADPKVIGLAVQAAECAQTQSGKPADRPECGDGWFIEPTVFANVSNSMRIAQEEVFGPVLSVIRFREDDEAYAMANDTAYGLAAGVWTNDQRRIFTAAKRLRAGSIWTNTYRAVSYMAPFGGFKNSGLGRESGQEAIHDYLETKCVWMSYGKDVPNPFVMR